MMNVKKLKPSVLIYAIIIVFSVIAYFVVGNMADDLYYSKVIILMLINIILAVSLNITVGCLGQITIGHAGFMSVGAYTASLISKALMSGNSGYIPLHYYFFSIMIGALVAGVVGVLVGIPALRLRGDYLAIITLAFGEIIRVFIEYFKFTGGGVGLSKIPKLSRNINYSVMFWMTIICVVIMFAIMTSRHGRAVLAIRDDEIAAEASGINITYYKTFAFTLSAIFAGIAGGMYAHQMGIIQAKTFDFNYSINILVMVVLGGMGSFTGAIISAIVLTILPEVLREFNDYRMIVYSLVLILIMIFRPSGILGRSEFRISRILSLFRKKEVKNER